MTYSDRSSRNSCRLYDSCHPGLLRVCLSSTDRLVEIKVGRHRHRYGAQDQHAPEHGVRAPGMGETQIAVAPRAADVLDLLVRDHSGAGPARDPVDDRGGVRDHDQLRRGPQEVRGVGAAAGDRHPALPAAVTRAGAAAGVSHQRVLPALRRGAQSVGFQC